MSMLESKLNRGYGKDNEEKLINQSPMPLKGTYFSNNANINPLMMSGMSNDNQRYGNENENNIQMSFAFKERSGKIKWREIMRIDIDSLIRNNDLTPLEACLENLVFSSIDENDIQSVPETNCVKLIKIYQYTLEYLIYSQQRLEYENKNLEAHCNQMINETFLKDQTLKDNKNLIHTLKKDKKEKEMALLTYKCILDEKKVPGQLMNNQKPDETIKSAVKFFCQICSGKKFSTEEKLENHMKRRHLMQTLKKDQPEKENEKEKETISNPESTFHFEKKLEDMKTYFENYMKTFQSENYLRLFENQKTLENKFAEVKNENMNEMEKTFKSTLMEMKDFYIKNSLNAINNFATGMNIAQQPPLGNSIYPPSKDTTNTNEEFINTLKDQMFKMNQTLMEVNYQQDQKIQTVLEQMSCFKLNVTDEINQLKLQKKKDKKEKKEKKEAEKEKEKEKEKREAEKEKEKREAEKEKEKEKEKREAEKEKEKEKPKIVEPQIYHASSIEVAAEHKLIQKSNPILIRDNALTTSIEKTKFHFNSGHLESAHDSEEEPHKRHPPFKPSPLVVNESSFKDVVIIESNKFSFAPSVKASTEEKISFEKPKEVEEVKPVQKEIVQLQPAIEKPMAIRTNIEQKLEPQIVKKPELRTEAKVEENTEEIMNQFYREFMKRDNSLPKKKKVEQYLLRTTPQLYEPSKTNLDLTLKERLEKVTKENNPSKNQIQFETLQESSKADIVNLITTAIQNIDEMKRKGNMIEYYYDILRTTIGMENFEKEKQKLTGDIAFTNDKKKGQGFSNILRESDDAIKIMDEDPEVPLNNKSPIEANIRDKINSRKEYPPSGESHQAPSNETISNRRNKYEIPEIEEAEFHQENQ